MAMLSNQMEYTYEISLEIFHGASPVIFQANRWGDFGGCLTKPSFSGYLSDRPHEINTGSLGTHIYKYIYIYYGDASTSFLLYQNIQHFLEMNSDKFQLFRSEIWDVFPDHPPCECGFHIQQ